MSTSNEREVAHRLFASEFIRATSSINDGEADRAPQYLLSPTGALINRLFVIGVLTADEWVNDETLRARVADPTGTFVVYASQYQQEVRAAIDELEPPTYVAVTGKANAFQPEGSDRVFTSIRPEAVAVVERATRDRWTVHTAHHTIGRIGSMARAMLDRTDDPNARRAIDTYGVTPGYLTQLYDLVTHALEVVAGEQPVTASRSPDPTTTDEPTISLEHIVRITAEAESLDPLAAAALVESSPAASTGVPSEDPALTDPTDTFASTHDPSQITDTGADTPDSASESEPVSRADESATNDESTILDDAATESTEDRSPSLPYEDPDIPDDVVTDDERAEVEETYGTEFTTGAAVDPPAADPPDDGAAGVATDANDGGLADQVVALMTMLDEGEGVTEAQLVTEATAKYNVSSDAVTTAIQDALMDGKCYEPTEDTYMPI